MNPMHRPILIVLSLIALLSSSRGSESHDVVVYGGTPGGITAAIAASREGLSVVLLEQTRHVGGMSTSGLNRDELEHMDKKTMGGLSEFFVNEAGFHQNPRATSFEARVFGSRTLPRRSFLRCWKRQRCLCAMNNCSMGWPRWTVGSPS
jgi:choline dehydrogenase-like flavoprotein